MECEVSFSVALEYNDACCPSLPTATSPFLLFCSGLRKCVRAIKTEVVGVSGDGGTDLLNDADDVATCKDDSRFTCSLAGNGALWSTTVAAVGDGFAECTESDCLERSFCIEIAKRGVGGDCNILGVILALSIATCSTPLAPADEYDKVVSISGGLPWFSEDSCRRRCSHSDDLLSHPIFFF
jgi:hypothetical protein